MADTVLEVAVPARLPSIGALRRAVEHFLSNQTDTSRCYEIVLAVSELGTNAVEALRNPDAEVRLRASHLDDRIVVEMEDCGPGFAEATTRRGNPMDTEGGRGLQVVQALADEFSVSRRGKRTTVRCAFAI